MFKKIMSTIFLFSITLTCVFAGGTYEENLKKADEYAAKKQYIYAMGYYYDAMEAQPNGYSSDAYNKFTAIQKLIESGLPGSSDYDDFSIEDGWISLIQDFEKYFSETPIFALNVKAVIGNADKKTKKYELKYKLFSNFSEKFGILYTSTFNGLRKAKKSNWDNLKLWPKESVFKNTKSSAALVTLNSGYYSFSTSLFGYKFSDKGWKIPEVFTFRSNCLSDGGYYYYQDETDGYNTTVLASDLFANSISQKAKSTRYVPAWFSTAKQNKNGYSFYNVSFCIKDDKGVKSFTSKKGRLIAPVYSSDSYELDNLAYTIEMISPETKKLLDSRNFTIDVDSIELVSPTFTYVPEKNSAWDTCKEVVSKTSANQVGLYSSRKYNVNNSTWDPAKDIYVSGNLLTIVSKDITQVLESLKSDYNTAYSGLQKKVNANSKVLSTEQQAYAKKVMDEATAAFKGTDVVLAKNKISELKFVSESMDTLVTEITSGNTSLDSANKKVTEYKSILSEKQEEAAIAAIADYKNALGLFDLDGINSKKVVFEKSIETLDGYYTSVKDGKAAYDVTNKKLNDYKSVLSEAQTKKADEAAVALDTSLKGLNLEDMKAKAATLDKEVATLDGYYSSVTEGNENIKKANARIQELKSTLSEAQTKAAENAVVALDTSLKDLNLDDMKAKAASLSKEVENVEVLYKNVVDGNALVKKSNEKIQGLKSTLSDAQTKVAESTVAALDTSLKGTDVNAIADKSTKAEEAVAKLDVYKALVDSGNEYVEAAKKEIATYNETLSDAQRKASNDAVESFVKVFKGTDEAAIEKSKSNVAAELENLKAELEAVNNAKDAISSINAKIDNCASLLNDAQTAPCKNAIAAVEKVMVETNIDAIKSAIENLNKAGSEINKALKEKFVAYNNMTAEEFSNSMIKVEKTKYMIAPVEVTQAMWNRVMGSNDCEIKGDLLPVTNVSLYEIIVFLNKLSMEAGLTPVYSINKSTDPATWGEIPAEDSKDWNKITVNAKANGFKLLSTKDVLGMYKTWKKDVYFEEALHDVGEYDCKSNYTLDGDKRVYDVETFDLSGNAVEMCFDKTAAFLKGPKATAIKNFEKDPTVGFRIYRNEK